MSLVKLDIHAVRNIQQQSLILAPTLNFIYGANGSGKSALLEAVYILGRAKSFRSATIKPVINDRHDHLIVSAQILKPYGRSGHLGVKLDGKTIEIRIDRQSFSKRSDLAYALPLQLIHPKSYELLDAGPQARREFLDWGVFHDNENFLPVWRRFKKALLQRNSLLKSRQSSQIDVWNKELVYYGTIVDSYRRRYLEKLTPEFIGIVDQFLAIGGIELKAVSGWDTSLEYHQVLIDDLDRDLRDGFTHSGPHRGDFRLTVKQRLAKDYVSRGQLKLLVISLKLAQVRLFSNNAISGCILIDDFTAELDTTNRTKMLRYLIETGNQVLVTSTGLEDFGDFRQTKNSKVFHVEHGQIKPV